MNPKIGAAPVQVALKQADSIIREIPFHMEDRTMSTSLKHAAVVDISTKAVQRLEESQSPLSDTELANLYQVYLKVGNKDLLGNLAQELSTLSLEDRALALSAMADADTDTDIKALLNQIKTLGGNDLHRFLTAADHADEALGDFLEVSARLRGDQRSRFLATADYLTRTSGDRNRDDLENYISAAMNTEVSLDDLTITTMGLNRGDRANFLAGAAAAGDDADRLIKFAGQFEETELSEFLESAAQAGKGIKYLFSLTEDLEGDERKTFFSFTAGLEGSVTRNFLLATQGDTDMAKRLMDVGEELNGEQRDEFFLAAAGAGNSLGRLASFVKNLAAGSGELDDFLASALKSGERLGSFLNMTGTVSGSERRRLLEFTSDLSIPDLANCILAAQKEGGALNDLTKTAGTLDGKNRSYFLYAATLSDAAGEDLVSLAKTLSGDELADFLYTAANLGEDADDFIHQAKTLKGEEFSQFLADEKNRVMMAEGSSLKKAYIYLSSAYEEEELDAILKAGKNIDSLLGYMETVGKKGLDPGQKKELTFIAGRSGRHIETLYATAAKLTDEELGEFIEFSRQLSVKDLGNFITAAAEPMGLFTDHLGNLADSHADKPGGRERPAGSGQTLSSLITVARSLGRTEKEDFLEAAASAGDGLQDLMVMTRRLGGENRSAFLTAASAVKGNIRIFLNVSEQMLAEDLNRFVGAANQEKTTPWGLVLNDNGVFSLKGTSPGMVADFSKSVANMGSDAKEWMITLL